MTIITIFSPGAKTKETQQETSGSCDRASLMQEKKEPTDDTSKDVYSLLD